MLSAAHDILKEEEGGDNNGTSAANFTVCFFTMILNKSKTARSIKAV